VHLLHTTACNIIVERTHLTRGDLLKVTSRTYILSPNVHFILPPAPRIFEVKPAIYTGSNCSNVSCGGVRSQYQVLVHSQEVLDIQYRPMYFYIYPHPYLLKPVCTVHYNRAPVTSATSHTWNQNSLIVQTMFISSHENEQ
jgi:hypothetical protein